jgi:hypothetical protein
MQRADARDADPARAARWLDEAKASVKEHAFRMKRAAVRDATRDGDDGARGGDDDDDDARARWIRTRITCARR